jgi:general secretion pathway protein I
VRTSAPDPRRAARGFTLIEVMVALVVVAVSMTAAILAVSERTRDGTYLRDKTLAHWIAMNVITERRLQPQAPAIGKTSDEVEFAGRRWRWTMVVDKTAVDTMRRIDVSVRTQDASEDTSLASVTGFFGTAIVPPGTTTVRWDVGPQGGQGPNGDQNGDENGEDAESDLGNEDDDGQDDDGQADDGGDSIDDGGDSTDDGSNEDGGDDGASDVTPEGEGPEGDE